MLTGSLLQPAAYQKLNQLSYLLKHMVSSCTLAHAFLHAALLTADLLFHQQHDVNSVSPASLPTSEGPTLSVTACMQSGCFAQLACIQPDARNLRTAPRAQKPTGMPSSSCCRTIEPAARWLQLENVGLTMTGTDALCFLHSTEHIASTALFHNVICLMCVIDIALIWLGRT